MAEKLPQTYANHVRWHPQFHFFLLPCSAIVAILGIVNVIRHYESLEAWVVFLLAAMAPIAVFLIRINPLRAQDRLIRLEERLRLASLLSEPLKPRIGELTESQLLALPFAPYPLVPDLPHHALNAITLPKPLK